MEAEPDKGWQPLALEDPPLGPSRTAALFVLVSSWLPFALLAHGWIVLDQADPPTAYPALLLVLALLGAALLLLGSLYLSDPAIRGRMLVPSTFVAMLLFVPTVLYLSSAYGLRDALDARANLFWWYFSGLFLIDVVLFTSIMMHKGTLPRRLALSKGALVGFLVLPVALFLLATFPQQQYLAETARRSPGPLVVSIVATLLWGLSRARRGGK